METRKLTKTHHRGLLTTRVISVGGPNADPLLQSSVSC